MKRFHRMLPLMVMIMASFSEMAESAGYNFRILTDKPVEDIVVNCVRSRDYLIAHNASSYSEVYNHLVVKSGKTNSCGFIFLGKHARIEVFHPTYTLDYEEEADVNLAIHMVPSLEFLDRLDREFSTTQAGQKDNGLENFLLRIENACGFTMHAAKEYLSNFPKDVELNYGVFKKRYRKDAEMCLRRLEEIRHNYNRSPASYFFNGSGQQCISLSGNACLQPLYQPEYAIKQALAAIWGKQLWYPYLVGDEGERNRALGIKHTYLVVLNDKNQAGGTWFLIDAFSKKDITDKYADFIPYDDKPRWMSDSQRARFVKGCDGRDLHWDIDEDPSGWLQKYAQGEIQHIVCGK